MRPEDFCATFVPCPDCSEKGRVEGEFHYAELTDSSIRIVRRDDDECLTKLPRSFWKLKQNIAEVLSNHDQAARHFYAAGQAEALGRVDRAAEVLADHTQDLVISSPGQETPFWTVYGLHDYEDGTTGGTPTEALFAAAPLEGGTGTGEAGLVGTTASAPESEVLPSTGTARVAVTATVKCDGCGYATEQISPGANIINERCCKCFAGFMRPIGTIFELDLFRERLEWFAATFGTDEEKRSEYVGKHLQDLAAELKTLIDNCREQYVPALAADPVQEGRAVGPIGDGTPHARMHWFWERMERHADLITELTGHHWTSSNYRFEAAIADAFDILAATRADHTEGNDQDAGEDASPTDNPELQITPNLSKHLESAPTKPDLQEAAEATPLNEMTLHGNARRQGKDAFKSIEFDDLDGYGCILFAPLEFPDGPVEIVVRSATPPKEAGTDG